MTADTRPAGRTLTDIPAHAGASVGTGGRAHGYIIVRKESQ